MRVEPVEGRTYTFARPRLYRKQEAALFHDKRWGVVEASTKSGKTVACLAWLAERAYTAGGVGRVHWWVAPTYAQARMAYRRQKRSLPMDSYTANDSELMIVFRHNQAVQRFVSADYPDALFGEDVWAAVIDEATRCKEESWVAVRSTLTATRGPARIIGNVKGRKNWAYRMARAAESGEPDMHYAKITAHDAVEAGVLADVEVADAKRRLTDHVFRELYLAEPSDDEGNPFGLLAIRDKTVKWSENDRGRGLAPGPADSCGVDLAKSVDWNVVIGLNRHGSVCVFERWQAPWELTIQKVRALVKRTKCLVDSTGVGDPVLEALQKGSFRNFEGEVFSAGSKQRLMEGLAVGIQDQQSGLTFPDGPIPRELEAYEYEYTRTGVRYGAPSGLHDDCVTALALAWKCHNRRRSAFFWVP